MNDRFFKSLPHQQIQTVNTKQKKNLLKICNKIIKKKKNGQIFT